MTVSERKANLLDVVRHLKGCLSRLQLASDFIAGDEFRPEFCLLIDAELLECNARLDTIVREAFVPDR